MSASLKQNLVKKWVKIYMRYK